MPNIQEIISNWREGLLSDVEALIMLLADLPPSAATDSVIEIVGKMHDEEKAEWDDRAELAAMIHGAEEIDV